MIIRYLDPWGNEASKGNMSKLSSTRARRTRLDSHRAEN